MEKIGYYIYSHTRPDTGEIFYIGKGTKYNSPYKSMMYKRAYCIKRNKYWKHIVSKNNGEFTVTILEERKRKDAINKLEQKYIARLGREGTVLFGHLTNMTDGGDGGENMNVSQETRLKLSKLFSGENHPNWGKTLSEETCRRKSESMKNSPKNLKGKKLPDWWKDRMRQTKIGEQNPMYGKRGSETPRARLVLDQEIGVYWDSVSEAAEIYGFQMKTLYNMLSGHRKNKTNLILV